jgi:hypothetical protein
VTGTSSFPPDGKLLSAGASCNCTCDNGMNDLVIPGALPLACGAALLFCNMRLYGPDATESRLITAQLLPPESRGSKELTSEIIDF